MLRQYMVGHPQMRNSPERDSVLQIVCGFKSGFTITDLEAKIEEAKIRMSKASLYNHMKLFTEVNIVHRLARQFGQSKTLYEVTLGRKESMQFICNRCGRRGEIHDMGIHRIIRERRYNNFVPETYSLYVYGMCKICRSIEYRTGNGRNHPKGK